MTEYAALPRPADMLEIRAKETNDNQFIVWPTHILFTGFCLIFVYMSLVYCKTDTESLLFLISVMFFSQSQGTKTSK